MAFPSPLENGVDKLQQSKVGGTVKKGVNNVKDKAQKIASKASAKVDKAKGNIKKATGKVTGFVGGLFKKK